jgi:hypothetical protein
MRSGGRNALRTADETPALLIDREPSAPREQWNSERIFL